MCNLYTLGFTYVHFFTICKHLLGRYSFYFVDKETEVQRVSVTCARLLGHYGFDSKWMGLQNIETFQVTQKSQERATIFKVLEDISKQNINLSMKPLFRKLFILGHPQNIFLLQK